MLSKHYGAQGAGEVLAFVQNTADHLGNSHQYGQSRQYLVPLANETIQIDFH